MDADLEQDTPPEIVSDANEFCTAPDSGLAVVLDDVAAAQVDFGFEWLETPEPQWVVDQYPVKSSIRPGYEKAIMNQFPTPLLPLRPAIAEQPPIADHNLEVPARPSGVPGDHQRSPTRPPDRDRDRIQEAAHSSSPIYARRSGMAKWSRSTSGTVRARSSTLA